MSGWDDEEDERPLRVIAWSRFKAWCRRLARRIWPRKPLPPRETTSVTTAAMREMLKRHYSDELVAAQVNRPSPLFDAVTKREPASHFYRATPRWSPPADHDPGDEDRR